MPPLLYATAKRNPEAFLDITVGTNAVFGDICAGNLQTALTQALDTFQAACDNFPPID